MNPQNSNYPDPLGPGKPYSTFSEFVYSSTLYICGIIFVLVTFCLTAHFLRWEAGSKKGIVSPKVTQQSIGRARTRAQDPDSQEVLHPSCGWGTTSHHSVLLVEPRLSMSSVCSLPSSHLSSLLSSNLKASYPLPLFHRFTSADLVALTLAPGLVFLFRTLGWFVVPIPQLQGNRMISPALSLRVDFL